MADYVVGTVFAADAVVSAADLDAEFVLAQTALNALDEKNFEADGIPLSALVRQRAHDTLTTGDTRGIRNQAGETLTVLSGEDETLVLWLGELTVDTWLTGVSLYTRGQSGAGSVSFQMALSRDGIEFRNVGPVLVPVSLDVVKVEDMDVLMESGQHLAVRATFVGERELDAWRWTATVAARLVDHDA